MNEAAKLCERISHSQIDAMANALAALRARDGRLYIIGIGGSLANAVHMAADLRKLCMIDAETFDNLAEITARANDEGFETIFEQWMSEIEAKDALMVLSVGGGTMHVSKAILLAVQQAKRAGAKVLGIVGPNGGETYERGDLVIRVPAEGGHITPHTESFQAVLWHCLVSHPLLQRKATKW
jgi:D-sedoheptulose 7-phosphate isomerase